jgi:hypothetical protein
LSASEVDIETLIILLLLIGTAIAAVLFWRAKTGTASKSRTKKIAKTTKSSSQQRSPYRATSIISNDGACDAVKSIGNKRFLDVDRILPALPSPDCNAHKCDCRYEQHEDRRAYDEDRRSPSPLKTGFYEIVGETNHRHKKRGRRKDDWA